MVAPVIISALTILSMVLVVLFKPYIKVGRIRLGLYWLVCLFGAVLMLIFSQVSLKEAWQGITKQSAVNPLKILALFLSMTLLSIYLGDAGFFYLVANKVFAKNSKGGKKLFILLYVTVAVLTTFTSNDIVILTFTPPICIFCKRAKISPIPFLIAEFIAANTWSMALVIGNPTNIYLAQTAGITFWEYLSTMWLPTLVGGMISLAVLLLIFNKTLQQKVSNTEKSEKIATADYPAMIVALVILALTIILLAISDIIRVESWLICVIMAGVLTIFNIVYDLIKYKTLLKVYFTFRKAPYELIPFLLSMFVIVLGLESCNFTSILSKVLIANNKIDFISFGYLSAGASNLLNNIPMSVLFEKIINGFSDNNYAVYGAIVGSNIGAFITPIGALAGIMWNKILSDYEVKISFSKFILYGVSVAIPTILATTLTLLII